MNGQTEREYRDALDGLRFSDKAKGRMMKNLIEQRGPAPEKRRGVRTLRAGLVAAVLCAVLVLTAGAAAAYQLIVQIHSDKEIDGEHYVGFQVYGDFTRFPLSDFSPELIAACEENLDPYSIVQPSFSTWKDVQDFLGRAIPCVWAKDDADVWYRDGDDMSEVSEDYKYRAELWQNDETRRLDGVTVHYYLDLGSGLTAMVDMTIFAETLQPPEDWDGSIGGMFEYQNRRVERLESYAMPNGAVAEVVMIHGTAEDRHSQCYGNFVYEGIFYQITVDGRQDVPQEEFVFQLHGVLDSFQ